METFLWSLPAICLLVFFTATGIYQKVQKWRDIKNAWRAVGIMHGEYAWGGGHATQVLYRNEITGQTKTETLDGLWTVEQLGISREAQDDD
jgi:hypothetical protein